MVSNDFYVGKGRMLTHRGQKFREGSRFPAADLGLDEKSFATLVRDGSIVTGKERNAFVYPSPAPAAERPARSAALSRALHKTARTAPPPPAPPPAPPKEDGLEEMKKDDLLDMADDLGIKVSSRGNKEEIIKAIREKTK